MSCVEEAIVSEYFEQNGFLVRPLRKSRSHTKKGYEEGLDLYVRNMVFREGSRDPNFLLFSSELRYLESAIVCVRGWFGDKASLASMSSGAEIVKYLETYVFKKVDKWFAYDPAVTFGTRVPPMHVLVAPVFPTQEPHRSQCIELLQEKGVHGIVSFKSMALDLIDRVDTKQVYEKSDLLQTLRILKNFDLVKDSQMDLLG
ncbi:hypothetical protein IEN85_22450 [Pelagicoccus sp. NFK12]|uniref:Uncharacterized protein n=1 Tax=Pelagicoccus enzymogenes TaxID=2773457 RepID=A0A927IHH0_9BACT|nr:hypothetical protein [Pelagicoccus enzymogenes]MBD5782277.1 hypothetical protein [Pelagicoccus enzymogenes]MDQ8197827.1 hypothetical protein [Pelagicoccus enzymogenes]